MRQASLLVVLSAMVSAASCAPGGGGGGNSGSSRICSAGLACTPIDAADPCKVYETACDGATADATCADTRDQADGVPCGSGTVCSSGACAAACVAGTPCTPPGSASACQTYATTCDSTLAHTTCSVAPTGQDGGAGGTGGTCGGGACVTACGQPCAPQGAPNPCATYVTACEPGGTPSCAVSTLLADGAACGVGNVCLAASCVAACIPGLAGRPSATPNSCRVYATACNATLTASTCGPTSTRPSGTACGAGGACTTGNCLGGAPPTISPGTGSYVTGQVVTITNPVTGGVVYYTTDGSEPDNSETITSPSFTAGSHAIPLLASTVVKAFTVAYAMRSPTASASYAISPPTPAPPPPDYDAGFTPGLVQLNGNAVLDGKRLQLTNDRRNEVASAFYVVPVNVQSFTADFTFQMTTAGTASLADGVTFTLQGSGPFAIGSLGGGMGYGPEPIWGSFSSAIGTSVAVKFDTYDGIGEGANSMGVYVNGVAPALPADQLPRATIDLHSGHRFAVHLDHAGATLTVMIADATVPAPHPTFTQSYVVDIPPAVGGPTAWVGFTAATGGHTSKQEILTWTFDPR